MSNSRASELRPSLFNSRRSPSKHTRCLPLTEYAGISSSTRWSLRRMRNLRRSWCDRTSGAIEHLVLVRCSMHRAARSAWCRYCRLFADIECVSTVRFRSLDCQRTAIALRHSSVQQVQVSIEKSVHMQAFRRCHSNAHLDLNSIVMTVSPLTL